ncbi:Anaerobic selenocysteine-containing dehydrogenase [Desulfuromusa kysingii]|uniref:Anaerobic selenocysteine-containing dehydrogenase n=1 Tax=Desulfuromusa kysingii TaxID=37625 RepID=A0A1H4DRU5_9BACT|nr:molybdopterin oxidoreductase family protein [Desulfuromusa kysingii]SEA75474.1 Anaerobic selenocysteine-containing dehydrogenase [Desulfuromusa kysingii]
MCREIKRSVCPYDCPDACSLLVEVRDGKACNVKGDPDHPFTRGTLCPKMNHYEKTVHSKRRLTTPLLRIGPKGSGEFKPVSWEYAIARIARSWQAIIDTCGAEAILPYSYAGTMGMIQKEAGHPFFYRLGASRLDRTICSPAKSKGWMAVMGATPTVSPDVAAQSDLVIIWGANTVSTNIHFLHGVNKAKKNGGKVWVIDTYQTPTAAISDEFFLIRPGTDGALALGLMHLLDRDGLLDRTFLDQQVQGFSELKEQILPNYPPPIVSHLTGLPIATLEAMATAYGHARAPFIRLGSGLTRYGNGAMTARSIVALPALVGAYGKPGGGCFADTSTGCYFDKASVHREDFIDRPTRIINMNQLGHALTVENHPPIRSLYVYAANPAVAAPDQNQVIKGLEREDLFTVVHERFMTDTARYADIVLPATSSLEHEDIYRAYGSYCVQRAFPVILPVGESKSNWQVFSLLAHAMGFKESFFQQSESEMLEAFLLKSAHRLHEVDFSALRSGQPLELPIPNGDKLYQTPSGKIEIFNPRLEHPLPIYMAPHGGDLPLQLMTAPSLYALNSSFYEQDDLRRQQQKMLLMMNPADAESRNLVAGEQVTARNERGEVDFILDVTDKTPAGVVVAEGVWWIEFAPGVRSVNALTSQRLTDDGGGSTFYDTRIEVEKGKSRDVLLSNSLI